MFRPAAGKAECRGEQHHAVHFRVPRRVEGREIAAQTGLDQANRLTFRGALDDGKLSGNGEVFEIASGEVGDFYM